MIRSHRLKLAATLPALLASCAALKPGDAPVTMRVAPTFAAASGPLAPDNIAVAAVQARGVSAGKRYAYVTADAPAEIHQAATLFWEDPPASVVERALVAGLRTRYRTVTGPEVVLPADQRVLVVLNRFEESGAGRSGRAVVAFDASVSHAGKITQTGSFCGAAPIGDASATSRARAFEQALATSVGELVQAMGAPDTAVAGSSVPLC